MDFWAAQKRARSRTKYCIATFVAMLVFVGYLADQLLRLYFPEVYTTPLPLFGLAMALVILLVSLSQYLAIRSQGGGFIARQAQGRKIGPKSFDFKEQQLFNVVQEMALAAGLPVPEVYVIDHREEINAFAAGIDQDRAAIAVTKGALNAFSRAELQGVIAHEFGHIYNKDMRMSIYMAAMLSGLFFLAVWGYKLLYYSSFSMRMSRQDGLRQGPFIVVVALLLLLAGAVTWFLGLILRAMVSRQREYLADACAVQFTRSTEGISAALKKIACSNVHDMPPSEMAFSHLYFQPYSLMESLFATHPPLKKRIMAIEGGEYLPEEWKNELYK